MTDINIVKGPPTWSADKANTLFIDEPNKTYYLTYAYGDSEGIGHWSLNKEIAELLEAIITEKSAPTQDVLGRS
jgi:hypothetical protein